MRARLISFALMVFVVVPSLRASGQGPQDLKRLSIEQLMQIDVTLATRTPEPLATAPTAISIVTGDDIRRAGVSTLADAVALADGVHGARFNNGTWSVTARGFAAIAANKMLVMIDGRTVYSPLFTGVFWNALDYELEDIDRIEVVRGPGATLWGANAVNGVVNIVTKNSRDTSGLFMQVGTGNEDPADAEVRYGGHVGAATYRAYAKFIERASQRYSTGISAGDRRQRGQVGARFDGGDQSRGAWMVKGDLFHSADALPDRPSGEFTLGDLQAVWSRAITPRSQLQVSSYLNHEQRRIPLQLTHRLTTVDLDAQQSMTLSRHALVWGGGARVNRDSTDGSALISFDPADRTYRVNNLYVQDEVAVQPRSERRRVEAERTAALERERDANRLKDEFLATLSHELRTPLGAVLGWTRVLRTTRVNDAMRERALEVIERNARAQAHLIEDLLEISRIVAGKPTLKVRAVDLAEIVGAAVEVVRPAAAAKRIDLVTDVAIRPAVTSGDPDRLQQIVWNLVSNAVKFTPPNGTATVRLTKKDGFCLEVSDTGQGIDPTFLPHVFDAFRQADGTTTREHGGLGLGLTIARQLAELHGGTITASSPGVGRGSTFALQLPSVVREPYAAEPLPQGRSSQVDAVEGRDLLRDVRVLVVDDQEDARDLLRAMLSQYGALVITVDSARAALEEIDQRPPDVVLSDVGMPREDGYDLIRQLRRRTTQQGGRIPAIAVTAYASVADRAAALESGYQAHVAKPLDPAELARTVAGVYREHLSTS